MSSIVSKATTDDSNPVSGFLLKELASTAISSQKEAENIRVALLKRVTKNSPDVKFKALKALRYVCANGPAEFRIMLQRDTADIKACTSFRCNPDPLRGEKPSLNVREAANECLDAIFNGTPASVQTPSSTTGRIQGFGTAAPESTSITGLHIRDKFKNIVLGQPDAKPAESSPLPPGYSQGVYGGATPQGKYQGFGSDNAASFNAAAASHGYRRYGSDSPVHATSTPSAPPSRPTKPPTFQRPSPRAAAGSAASEAEQGPGPLERQLVSAATAPSGVRVVPSPEERNRFVSACAELDAPAVCALLDDVLASGATTSVSKALCLLEALLLAESDAADDYFREHPARIRALDAHTSKLVRQAVDRVLRLLGLVTAPPQPEAAEAAPAPAPAPAPASSSAMVDLMSLMGEPAAPQASEGPLDIFMKAGTEPAAGGRDEPSAFSDLLGDGADKPGLGSVEDAFAGLSLEPTTDAPPYAQPSSDAIFAAQSASETIASLMGGQPAHAPSSEHTTSAFDFLESSSHNPSAQAAEVDVFAGISANPTPADTAASNAQKPQSKSSHAFDFVDDFM
jgi:hypothetical protein